MTDHQFLRYAERKPGERVLREIALVLMNQYANANLSRTKWLKQSPVPIPCQADTRGPNGEVIRKTWNSEPLSIVAIERNLAENLAFNHETFKLFPPLCGWLDSSVSIGPDFHALRTDKSGALTMEVQTNFGARFPIKPQIDREGYVFGGLQLLLQQDILKARRQLVATSASFRTSEYFNLLRLYFGDCVSLIDITLHQLYIKSEFDPLPGWRFDKETLGTRFGRRLNDKFCWVGVITGRPLDDAREEIEAFNIIKRLRNHLLHFDPPCFAYTMEEVATWLNHARRIAMLAWKIRAKLRSPISGPLIELILAPDVLFVPKDPKAQRLPLSSAVGYGSTCWPE